MITAVFLAAFIFTTIALASTSFILMGILPLILPQALRAARKEWIETVEKAREKLAAPAFEKTVREVSAAMAEIDRKLRNLGRVLAVGLSAAAVFILTGILGLWYLASFSVASGGIEMVATTDDIQLLLGAVFTLGLLLLFIFAGAFADIFTLYMKAESAEGAAKVQLVTGHGD